MAQWCVGEKGAWEDKSANAFSPTSEKRERLFHNLTRRNLFSGAPLSPPVPPLPHTTHHACPLCIRAPWRVSRSGERGPTGCGEHRRAGPLACRALARRTRPGARRRPSSKPPPLPAMRKDPCLQLGRREAGNGRRARRGGGLPAVASVDAKAAMFCFRSRPPAPRPSLSLSPKAGGKPQRGAVGAGAVGKGS